MTEFGGRITSKESNGEPVEFEIPLGRFDLDVREIYVPLPSGRSEVAMRNLAAPAPKIQPYIPPPSKPREKERPAISGIQLEEMSMRNLSQQERDEIRKKQDFAKIKSRPFTGQ
ncbi:hypothetical protein [Bremerella cremea]|uniref:hypothetical protein n=1 Tax=Bremerella cremea TaxID=1031537 RepID=UPI0011C06004|nr:hypothetical protein [Bremerella cremea]